MATQPLIPVADASAVLNSLAKQHIGESVVVNDDLSNIVDFGRAYDQLDSGTKQAVVSGLITLVTTQLFVVKEYKGNGLDVIRTRSVGGYDTSEGLIQKNRPALPTAVSDATVYDPEPGSTNDPFKNIPVNFETEYFFKPIAFRYEWSKPERWMTGMFLSINGFYTAVGAIDRMIANAIQLNIEDVTKSLLRGSIALNLSGGNSNRKVNLLAEYNAAYTPSTPLTAAVALQTPDFLRWAVHRIFVVFDYMKTYTRLYNEKGYPNFLDQSNASVVMLSQFRRAAQQFMLSDVYNQEYLQLPGAETVSDWKGLLSSVNAVPDFASTSAVKDTFEVSWEDDPIVVDENGIVAHVFDPERIGIYDFSTVVTSMKDPIGLKTNYFTHVFAKGIVDPYENGVTFVIQD